MKNKSQTKDKKNYTNKCLHQIKVIKKVNNKNSKQNKQNNKKILQIKYQIDNYPS